MGGIRLAAIYIFGSQIFSAKLNGLCPSLRPVRTEIHSRFTIQFGCSDFSQRAGWQHFICVAISNSTRSTALFGPLKNLVTNSTYEFLLNTSTIAIVAGVVMLTVSISADDALWLRVVQSVLFLLAMVFFTSSAIMREVRSPIQRVVYWSVVIAWVAPASFAAFYLLARDYGECLQNAEGILDYLYFSYVTFTTLGYGDIQPSGFCRGLSAAEAISGYILLGALVAAFSKLPQRQKQRASS